ncbi:hypothetical protein TIFTF001_015500 [Ficus carica]|uniref:Uncharacterized protein n=1 Tax=Ficus carica TaxID=3494 RepID=A0AA87ZYU9_FICCA|nr:hypothetical protein TIFTF001_015500 [Ficus carica]
MPKIPPAATPNVVGLSGGGWPVAPPLITCKREAPRNDGDTGVVSAVDTPMLKRFSWVRVLGATRSGRLPRVPGGVPWASPVKGQQCPSEWLAAGGDLTSDRSRWVASVAGAPRTRQAEKATRKSDQSRKVYRCTVPGICWSERVGHQHKPHSISGQVQVRDASCTGDMSDPNKRSPAWHKCTSGRLLGHHRVLGDEYLARRHVAVSTCRTHDASNSPHVEVPRVEPSARHVAAGGKMNRLPNSNFEFKGMIDVKLNRRLGIRIRSDHWAPLNRRGGASFAIICEEDYLSRAVESY